MLLRNGMRVMTRRCEKMGQVGKRGTAAAVAAYAAGAADEEDPWKGKKLGWVGTGIMGKSMAANLLGAGYDVTVTSRTLEKARALEERGARVVGSAREVAEESDVVFSIVGHPEDVESVMLDPESGALGGMREGGILVDMTTSRPSLAVAVAEAAAGRGVLSLDAPVSGGDVGARNGTLSIFVGGDEGAARSLQGVWNTLGSRWAHFGEAGRGQHAKLANQIFIAGGMLAMAEGLVYAEKAGLDLHKLLELCGAGAAASFSLSTYAPRILNGDFAPGFVVDHFVKDLGIALDEAQRMNLVYLPGLTQARTAYRILQQVGKGNHGTQAIQIIYWWLNNMRGVEPASFPPP